MKSTITQLPIALALTLAAAAYLSPNHHVTLRFGLGAGLTSESPDLTVHTGVLFRF